MSQTAKHNPKKRVLITAALPYANGALHVGHIAGAYLPADIYARFLKLKGVEVRTVCGSDDHGVAMILTASKEGKTPAAVAEHYHRKQKTALAGLKINFDVYGATSRNQYHTKLSQDFFLGLHSKGCFEKIKSEQFYDQSKQAFLPDRFVKGTCGYCAAAEQNGDQCESCGKMLDNITLKNAKSVLSGQPAIVKETIHWFIDLSRFEAQVSAWLDQALVREHTRSYVKGLLKEGLIKRSMTRDLAWGIPVPLDDPDAKNKVLYVWFDAPIGYISNTAELCQKMDGAAANLKDWWASPDTDVLHFIGEDNTIFHAVIWIAMLAAEGNYSLPRGVIVNHFLNIQFPGKEAEKMSKSRGKAVWIEEFIEQDGSVDALRYYLTMVAPESSRTAFNFDEYITRNNGELGATLGNLFQRVIQFTHKSFGPAVPVANRDALTAIDQDFRDKFKPALDETAEALERFEFRNALTRVVEFGRTCNKYLDETAPWKTIKTDRQRTESILLHTFDALKLLGILMSPFMPESSEKICRMLNLKTEDFTWDKALLPLSAGQKLSAAEILFPRIEKDLEVANQAS